MDSFVASLKKGTSSNRSTDSMYTRRVQHTCAAQLTSFNYCSTSFAGQYNTVKADRSNCNNYRGLSIPGKICNRIILERIKGAVDEKLRENQAGFRKNRSSPTQIATLRIIVERSIEWNSPITINFIDYEKAFNSVDKETLWEIYEALQNLQRH